MNYRGLCLILLLFSCSCVNSEAKTDSRYFREALRLVEEDHNLGRQIVERLDFKANPKQLHMGGDHMKYTLKGRDGQLYIFKIYLAGEKGGAQDSVLAVKLSSLCGLKAVACYDLWLPFNKNQVYGLIQEKPDGASDFGCENIPAAENWMDYFLFRWFIGNDDIDWLLSPGGELINKDMDTLCDTKSIDFDSFEKYNFKKIIRLSLKEGSFDTYYRKALSFISYLEALPDESIIELCGPYAYKERIKALLLRKKRIRKEFTDYCRQIAKEEGKSIASSSQTDDSSLYAQGVLAGLKEKIAAKNALLKSLPDRVGVKKNINIIASKKMRDFSGPYLMDIPIEKVSAAAKGRGEELRILRQNTEDPYEILAYSLQINRYDQFMTLYPYGVLPLEEIPFIIAPETMDIGFAAANLCLSYSRGKELFHNRRVEKFWKYSVNDLGDNIGSLSPEGNDGGWEYIMKGNCYTDDLRVYDKNLPLQEYRKVIDAKVVEGEAKCLAHLLSGYLYELNDELFRFGPGCDLEKAEEEFKLAVKLCPASLTAHLNLLAIYLKKDDLTQAKKEIKQLAKLDPYWKDKDRQVSLLTNVNRQSLLLAIFDPESQHVLSLVYSIKDNGS